MLQLLENVLSSIHLLKFLEICSVIIGVSRWIIFVRSGSHFKMADKLALVDKEEVNYTFKTSSYSSSIHLTYMYTGFN